MLTDERRYTLGSSRVIVARVSEACEESPLLTESDREHLSTLISPTRRAQWCTCRHILRRELGAEASLRYVGSGALVLALPVGAISFVSISHSAEWVAVMLSTKRCGVDIESLERNFSRVASRYISHSERDRLAEVAGPHFEAIMWSAEEALYKYGSQPGLDFIHDMVVTAIDPAEGLLTAELYGHEAPPVHFHLLAEGQILSYITEEERHIL